MVNIKNIYVVFKRELKSYFEAPVAYVFLIAFLLLIGFLTFSVAMYYERNTADLSPFFFWHPWVYLLLVPAATMGLWAEERRSGTIELLLTMPITLTEAVIGKFLAGWAFITIAILLTFPIVITTIYLGSPDAGAILCGYVGSILMAGAYVSVGMFTSSMTRSQVIAFVLSLVFCLLLVMAGWPPVTNFFMKYAPGLVDIISSISFMAHYESIGRGVLDMGDIVYFISVMIFMGFATHLLLENRKSA